MQASSTEKGFGKYFAFILCRIAICVVLMELASEVRDPSAVAKLAHFSSFALNSSQSLSILSPSRPDIEYITR